MIISSLSQGLQADIPLTLVSQSVLQYFVATNGSDYRGLPIVVSFSPGRPLNMPICANITIIDDNTLENTEFFSVILFTDFPEVVFLSRDRSVVEIIDNEEGK